MTKKYDYSIIIIALLFLIIATVHYYFGNEFEWGTLPAFGNDHYLKTYKIINNVLFLLSRMNTALLILWFVKRKSKNSIIILASISLALVLLSYLNYYILSLDYNLGYKISYTMSIITGVLFLATILLWKFKVLPFSFIVLNILLVLDVYDFTKILGVNIGVIPLVDTLVIIMWYFVALGPIILLYPDTLNDLKDFIKRNKEITE